MRYKDGQEFMGANGYAIGGSWYPRVTRILDVKSKPALDIFFKEMGSYESAEAVKIKSAEEGSRVHEVVQQLALGNKITVPESVRPAAEVFVEFNKKRNINFHPDFIEQRVWSAYHRYAGTVDALAEIDGKFGVLDIKTSTGFYPEYNLQTAAYIQALAEPEIKRALALPRDVETRWILRIDQHRICGACGATLREKGGRMKIRVKRAKKDQCVDGNHSWGEVEGEAELREFPYFYRDIKAFLAAKTLWEWEYSYWLRTIGYAK